MSVSLLPSELPHTHEEAIQHFAEGVRKTINDLGLTREEFLAILE